MGCGVFSYNLVPIPHNKFTMCHRGLFDSYIDYIKVMSNQDHLNGLASLWSSIDAKKYWIFDKDQLLQMHDTINKLYEYRNQIFYTDLVQQIRQYAKSGLIDSKYENLEEIEKLYQYFYYSLNVFKIALFLEVVGLQELLQKFLFFIMVLWI